MSGLLPFLQQLLPSVPEWIFTHNFGNCRVLLQEIGQLLAYNTVYSRSGLAVAQFLLGLAFKLRLADLNADNGCKTFTDIFTGKAFFVILNNLFFLA